MRVLALILLACLAPSTALPHDGPDQCANQCAAFLNQYLKRPAQTQQICDALCATTGLLDGPCVQSMLSWAVNDTSKAATALAASESLIDYTAVLVPSLAKLTGGHVNAAAAFALQNDLRWLGHHDRCVAIPDAQYCHTSVVMGAPLGTIAFCLPQTCSAAALTQTLEAVTQILMVNQLVNNSIPNATNPLSAIGFQSVCGDQRGEWEGGTYVMVVLTCLIGLLALLAALAELFEETPPFLMLDESTKPEGETPLVDVKAKEDAIVVAEPQAPLWRELLDCFSMSRNYDSFCNIRTVATNSLDGMRALSMSWVVFGHTLLWPLLQGLGYSNVEDIIPITPGRAALMGSWTGQAVQSAEFSVDTFFYMSGFLAVYVGLKKLRKLQPLQVLQGAPLMYLDRWLRLTPLYMFVVWFYVYVIPTMASGPYWAVKDAQACKDYWWQNILYIQTIFTSLQIGGPGSGGCYGVSWYLADDFFFFYLVPFMICLALISTTLALACIGAGWSASIIYTLICTIENSWSAGTFDGTDYGNKYYQPPWTRCPPYLMGAAFAIIWYHWSSEITHRVSTSCFLRFGLLGAAAFLLLSTVYGLAGDAGSLPTTTPTGWMNLYVTFSKSAWTLGIICLNILCFSRIGGAIQWLLESPIFGYLGKLSYSMYLLHPTILVCIFGVQIAPEHYSIVNFLRSYVAALALTTVGGFVLHLLVELPCGNLAQLLMASFRKPKQPPPPYSNDTAQQVVVEDLEEALLEDELPNSPLFPAASTPNSRRNTSESRRSTTDRPISPRSAVQRLTAEDYVVRGSTGEDYVVRRLTVEEEKLHV